MRVRGCITNLCFTCCQKHAYCQGLGCGKLTIPVNPEAKASKSKIRTTSNANQPPSLEAFPLSYCKDTKNSLQSKNKAEQKATAVKT